jgi:hypothetical protein
MAKTNAERQKIFHKKMLAQGFSRVVVYAPLDRVAELRAMASMFREQWTDPALLVSMQAALIEAKGALSASVDENTKQGALKAVTQAIQKYRDYEEPI